MRTVLIVAALLCSTLNAADYPVVYVAIPRDPAVKGTVQDVKSIAEIAPGAHLRVLSPGGSDRLLWKGPDEHGGLMDPKVSLDGKRVYFAYTADARTVKSGFEAAINLYELTVATGAVRQLTFSTAAGDWNTGPCEVPGGRLLFTSTRNHLSPVSSITDGTNIRTSRELGVFQLFALKLSDPANSVEQVGFLNLRGALHPELMLDGRVMWSSHENHGLRTNDRIWGLWASLPDGRKWEPLWSAFSRIPNELASLHFQSQTKNGRVQLAYYYPAKSQGYGNILDFEPGKGFGNPDASRNPQIADSGTVLRFPFQPSGARSLTPWGTGKDSGHHGASHPSAAPDGLLLSYAFLATDDGGSNNHASRRVRDAGVYLARDAQPTAAHTDLVKMIDTTDYYEVQPRALLSWKQVYGVDPVQHPWLPDAAGKDYGYVGTSGVYARESKHVNVNAPRDRIPWVQGGDTRDFDNSEIDRIRIVFQAPTPRGCRPEKGAGWWRADGVERMGVLGEIPLRKFDAAGNPVRDAAGDPDTSFLAKVPADVSWTFQLLDRHGRVITHSMTWHQIRPGETRTDCRGCHAHHQPGIEFAGTAASKPDYQPADLTRSLRFVEWFRDVKPILTRHCGECHTGADPAGGFAITDDLRDHAHVRPFLSTQSHLVNAVLGLVEGLDRMPKGKTPMTSDEIRTLATWIDFGAPVNDGRFFEGLPAEGGGAPSEPEPTPVDPPLTDRQRIERLEIEVFGEVYPGGAKE